MLAINDKYSSQENLTIPSIVRESLFPSPVNCSRPMNAGSVSDQKDLASKLNSCLIDAIKSDAVRDEFIDVVRK